jgi:hypothetical protein
MRPMGRALVGAWLLAAGVRCSSVIGLEPPPADDGSLGVLDSGTPDGAPAETPTCAPLAAQGGGAGYYPFEQVALTGGDKTWTFFDSSQIPGFASTPKFAGGVFDGRYVYFPGQGRYVVRYDTRAGGFTNPVAWTRALLADATTSFAGAVFDGRYVYFVPGLHTGATTSPAARYDTLAPDDFSDPATLAWEFFDVSTLSAGGAATIGFFGGAFDGRYVYFVPHNDGAAFGRVLRFDTTSAIADGGRPGTFASPELWSSFDLSATTPLARGYSGAVLAGHELYLVPFKNDVFDAAVNFGANGVVAEYSVDAAFGAAGSWSTFDMTRINGLAFNDLGGAFDGRYVYFVPHNRGIVTRYDTSAPFGASASWQSYDTGRTATVDGGDPVPFAGATYDGRFVYLVPNNPAGAASVLRYDTASTFTAPCAWTSFDPTTVSTGFAASFVGAVFDGQYVYLVPATDVKGAPFVRFTAKATPSSPPLPFFHGSFL